MLLCAAFLPHSLPEWLHWQYEPYGEGKIISAEKTNMTVNDSSIYKIRFKQPDGTERISYSLKSFFKEGNEVPLEKSGNAVRIKGTKITSFGRLDAFVVMFPIAGIGMVCVCGFLGRKKYLFLRDGELTAGQFIDMNPTGVKINGCSEMKLRYRIITADRETSETFVKALDTDKITDNPVEPLLYNPLKPQNALALNKLPRGVWYDETDGSFNFNLLRCVISILCLAVFIAEFVFTAYAVQIGGLEIGGFSQAD
ncbi:hypothetical protein FACS189427_04000 [Planctomycetales bacterium]|nr:hypothetical protein FACS189427_04000 [Planctomycetales bacterium]